MAEEERGAGGALGLEGAGTWAGRGGRTAAVRMATLQILRQ